MRPVTVKRRSSVRINEVVIPLGLKDRWNRTSSHTAAARRPAVLRRLAALRWVAVTILAYPLTVIGHGKVRAALGDRDGALAIYLEQLKRTATLDLAARIGDLYAARGDAAQSEHYYQLAEDLAGPGVVQTEANLALYLADHDRKLSDAVTIAEAVSAKRRDIFTEDALAWAYYKAGRVKDAYAASQLALRTGTRDEALLARAARIRADAGR